MRFEDLEVWKRSARLSADLFRMFADLKDYGFRDQITRSSLSIPSNIAEGFERDSQRECLKFLSYAKGSCGELRTQIYVGIEIGYIAKEQGKTLVDETKEISLMLGGLIRTKKSFVSEQ
jgi:four helix bundle protein